MHIKKAQQQSSFSFQIINNSHQRESRNDQFGCAFGFLDQSNHQINNSNILAELKQQLQREQQEKNNSLKQFAQNKQIQDRKRQRKPIFIKYHQKLKNMEIDPNITNQSNSKSKMQQTKQSQLTLQQKKKNEQSINKIQTSINNKTIIKLSNSNKIEQLKDISGVQNNNQQMNVESNNRFSLSKMKLYSGQIKNQSIRLNENDDSLIINQENPHIFKQEISQIHTKKRQYSHLSRQSKDVFKEIIQQNISNNPTLNLSKIKPVQYNPKIGSLSVLLNQLPQYEFQEPQSQLNIPQLFRQCNRLNSISVNFATEMFNVFSVKHKQLVRRLIFELGMVSRILENLTQDICQREKKQKRVISHFTPEIFLEGQWIRVNQIKNINIIKPTGPFQRIKGEYSIIHNAIKISNDRLKQISLYIQEVHFQNTNQFRYNYIELRKILDQIYLNFKKISEDLFVKATTHNLPVYYTQFFNYLKSPLIINNNMQVQQIKSMIQYRKFMEQRIQYYKDEHDQLCSSIISVQIQQKLRVQLNVLKKRFYKEKKMNLCL